MAVENEISQIYKHYFTQPICLHFKKKYIEIMKSNIFRKRVIGDTAESNMNRTLTLPSLVVMGIAAIIGAGIFATISETLSHGGAGSVFLFAFTSLACLFSGLCYSHFASQTTEAGSAYTYSYYQLGEIVAFVVGWTLILEYAIGNIVVAISFSDYFSGLFKSFGVHIPEYLATGYQTAKLGVNDMAKAAWQNAPEFMGIKLIVNLPAFLSVAIISVLCYIGIRESKNTAIAMVALKIAVLLLLFGIGFFYIRIENYTPFFPLGYKGLMAGIASVFFSYIGFDAITSLSEEAKNPKRDMPRAIILSLGITTLLYLLACLVMIGVFPYNEWAGVKNALQEFFSRLGMTALGGVVSVIILIAMTSVLLVYQLGLPRIFMNMSRDGLIPNIFSKIHSRYRTPSFSTFITGVIVCIPVLFLDQQAVLELTSIGTLFAFDIVCIAVLYNKTVAKEGYQVKYINSRYVLLPLLLLFGVLYVVSPDLFTLNFTALNIPFLIFIVVGFGFIVFSIVKKLSLIPVLGLLCNTYLMSELPPHSWIRFFGWLAIGLLIYFFYSRKHSKLEVK